MRYPHLIFWQITFKVLTGGALVAQPAESRFVWTDSAGEGRLQVAYFRYELDLAAVPDSAVIHLFADSRYHLLVNGQFVNFGPARFYPAHPEYDTYDLRPWLQAGRNVIGVRVMSNGTLSFQLRRHRPGFIAWGKVGDRDLTTPGDWRCRRTEAWDEQAPRLSFALGPMEVVDLRKDPAGWELPGYDASGWGPPLARNEQQGWGRLAPRSIPPLTREEYAPQRLLGVYPLTDEEALFSFRVKTPDSTGAEFGHGYPLFAYTYIFSPRDQEVEAGLWWGEHFLNGEGPLAQTDAGSGRPHRQQALLRLKAGWNYFFVRRNSFWGKWDFFLALPRQAGLLLSPDRNEEDPLIFRTAGPFFRTEEARVKALAVPFAPEDLPADLSASWTDQRRDRDAGNPAIEMAWRYFGEKQDLPAWPVDEVTVDGPAGTALVYDFRFKKLGRIVVDYEAPAGTLIDVGFTEDLAGEQANVMKRVGLYMATRHIAAGGAGRLETFKPYGLRFLQVNVHGNAGAVRIRRVRVIHQVYPFEQTGSFECSDPLFNDLWQLGWRTLRVCAEDSYTDTPFRERGLYAGDMLPQIGVTMAGSADLRLVKRSLRLFQDMYVDQFNPGVPRHPDEIGLLEDYPLLTLEALSWYVDRTGDEAFAAELLPAYDRLLDSLWRQRNERGLIHNQRVFIEWTQLEKREVENTAYHAILARCFRLMSRLAERTGDGAAAREYTRRYEALAVTIREQFWVEEKGAYADGLKEGRRIDHSYPISSVWPYLAGVTTAEQEDRFFPFVAEVLRDIGSVNRQRETTPYGGFYLLAVLYDRGLPAVAERFMRQYWSPMVFDGNDTAWENFGAEGIGTRSHAWSAAPTYYLTTQVLGIPLGWPHPADPDTVVIAPQVDGIRWARGAAPHPRGVIRVAWEDRGNHLWMEVDAPEGVTWRAEPRGNLAEKTLWVNGEFVKGIR